MNKPLNLVILTSHRMDCFLLCWKCLIKHTDIRRFATIFILANEVSENHAALLHYIDKTTPNVVVVNYSPRGLQALSTAQNVVYQKQRDSVFIKIDEDVFVTEGWLDSLLDLYNRHLDDNTILFSPVVPNNQIGRKALFQFLSKRYPVEFTGKIRTGAVYLTPEYGKWIWDKVLHDNLVEAVREASSEIPEQGITGFLNINCILFDDRLMSHVLPFKDWDEREINTFLMQGKCMGLMTPKCVVHHYSFGPQQEYLDEHVPLSDIHAYLLPESIQYAEMLKVSLPQTAREGISPHLLVA